MTAVAEQVESASMSAEGFIGRIPVRNLWLLMLYASDLFRTRGIGNVGLEDSPDDLPDLVAEILAHAVEVRQRRRLSLGYRSRDAVINRVRGRIDVLTTERHHCWIEAWWRAGSTNSPSTPHVIVSSEQPWSPSPGLFRGRTLPIGAAHLRVA
jgi:hypothetical protein